MTKTWNDECKKCKHPRGEHGIRTFGSYKYPNGCLQMDARYTRCSCLQFDEGDNNEVIDRVYKKQIDCQPARVAPVDLII